MKCHKNCSKRPTDSKSNCIRCRNSNGIIAYPKEDDPTQCEVVPYDRYFLKNNKWAACFPKCATCSDRGDLTMMKCETCFYDEILDPDIPGNCIEKNCPDFWYKPTPISKECVSKCDSYSDGKTHECISKCSQNYLLYKYACYETCPQGSHRLNDTIKHCYPNEIINSTEFLRINTNFTVEEARLTIQEYLQDLIALNSSIKGTDYTLVVNSSLEHFQTIVPMMNFTQCKGLLREAYNIPSNEKIVMARFVMDFRQIIDYQVFDSHWKKLDLSLCSDILIPSYYAARAKMNQYDIDRAIALYNETGDDLLDPTDHFYNDICYSFTANESDVILKDRREKYYISSAFCDGCTYIKFDISNLLFHCDCSPYKEKNKSPEELDQFTTPLPFTHLLIALCFSQWTHWEKLLFTIGFWVGLASLALNLIFFGFFLCYGLKALRLYLKKVKIPKFKKPPMKKIKKQKTMLPKDDREKEALFDVISIKSIQEEKTEGKTTPLHQTLLMNQNKIDDSAKRIILPREEYAETNEIMNIKKTENNQYSRSEDKALWEDKNKRLISLNRHKHFRNTYLPYTQALREDNRRLNEIFWETCMTQHKLLELFHRKSLYDIPAIKFAVYLNTFTLMMALNAIFYTHSILSEKLENEGSISLPSSYLKSVYSYLLGELFMALLGCLCKFEDKFELLCSEMTNRELFEKRIKTQLILMNLKLCIFFMITIGMNVLMWHYMTMFCIIYDMNQYDWFEAGWISFAISLILSTLLCMIVSFLFYYSLYYKSRNTYYTAIYLKLKFG